jgi:phosphoglycolate phosphatase-like HAD superfamily hydrolase
MTVDSSPIGRILAASSSILLDFDGPVCSIFSGLADVAVADRLRAVLADAGVELDDSTRQTYDPLAVLLYANAQADRAVLAKVESTLILAEVEAVVSARPAPSAEQFIRAAGATGRSVGIVSNNSAAAVNTYLELHRLTPYIAAVVGRQRERPELMKPNSFPIEEALRQLSSTPETAVLIGDSPADEGAARTAGVAFIGYAETITQLERLDGANVLVRSMEELLKGL